MPRLSRRECAVLLAAALPLAAQPPSPVPPQGAPAAPSASAPPAERERSASDMVREASARLAKIEVPMDVEPAFAFRP